MDADVRERLEALVASFEVRPDFHRVPNTCGADLRALLTQPVVGREADAHSNTIVAFEPADPETGNAVIYPKEPDAGPYFTIIGCGPNGWQNRLAKLICDRFNAPLSAGAPDELVQKTHELPVEQFAENAKCSPGAPEGWREDAAGLLIECAQLLDTIKGEWEPDGSWSEWDQRVRDRITVWLRAYYEAAALTSSSSGQQDFRVSRDHAPSTCAALDWRPIDTAPTDGTPLLLICASAYSPTATEGWWMNGHGGEGWYHYSRPEEKWHGGVVRWFPTHWMPLPPPPSSQTEVPGERSRDGPITTPSSSSGEERDCLYCGRRKGPCKANNCPLVATPKGEGDDGGAKCKARASSSPDPQDCDWPHCDCDPKAGRVVEALIEEGWGSAAEIQRLREALGSAARVFRDYQALHLAKDTAEGREKAARNREHAEMCEAALNGSALGDDQGGAS